MICVKTVRPPCPAPLCFQIEPVGLAGSAWRCLSSLHCNSETGCCPLRGAVSLVLTAPKWIRGSHGPCVLSTAPPRPPLLHTEQPCSVTCGSWHSTGLPGVRQEPRAPSRQPNATITPAREKTVSPSCRMESYIQRLGHFWFFFKEFFFFSQF